MDEKEGTNKLQRVQDLVNLSLSLTKNILVYISSILGSESQRPIFLASYHKLCSIALSEKWQSLSLKSLDDYR